MKQTMLLLAAVLLCSCSSRSKAEREAYTDSLFHVISCSPAIVAGEYTLEDQLNACDLLIKECPNRKKEFEEIKEGIRHQIETQIEENSW